MALDFQMSFLPILALTSYTRSEVDFRTATTRSDRKPNYHLAMLSVHSFASRGNQEKENGRKPEKQSIELY